MGSLDSSDDPIAYGKRLLPSIVDERAKSSYSRPIASIARSRDPADGFEDISYARFANAVNRACHWLDAELPKSVGKDDISYTAYLGPNDLRYVVLWCATLKTGRKILFPSTRNTVSAYLSLFERTDCRTILYGVSFARALQPVFNATEHIEKLQFLDIEDLLDEHVVPQYDYHETIETVSSEKHLCFHTSGSSGNPKPFAWNNQFLCHLDSEHYLPPGQGNSIIRMMCEGKRLLNLLPLFHAGGMAFSMFVVFYEGTLVLCHADCPPTAGYLTSLLEHNRIDSILTPPSILAEMAKTSAAVNSLSKVRHVGYAGGPLHHSVGNVLAMRLPHLFSIIGATEYGWFHLRPGSSSDWEHLSFFDNVGYRFEEVTEGISELVIVNEPKTNIYHGTFNVLPTLKEYRMRDLYSPVHGKPGWWRYRGRVDDLIVLSSGEKIDPIPIEGAVQAHSSIKAALVVGEYRFLPSLLIEPEEGSIPSNDAERRQLLETVWPAIEKANMIAPRFAKVPKELVVFTSPEKPFLRAGKGTVQRQLTVMEYTEELDQAYSAAEFGLLTIDLILNNPKDGDEVTALVRKVYTKTMDVDDFQDEDDVFERGMDSLQVTIVVQKLRAALRSSDASLETAAVDAKLVYSAPSITQASAAITKLMQNGVSNGVDGTRAARLQQLLDRYSVPEQALHPSSLSNVFSKDSLVVRQPLTIILTGTTGSLGSYLLECLANAPTHQVGKIYCLNRSSDSEKKTTSASQSRGLHGTWDKSRVEFLTTNLSQPSLGLTEEKHTELLNCTTTIIHNAWKVDFNLSINSFETQIAGLHNLLLFSTQSKNHAHLAFLSSISATFNWQAQHPDLPVPESTIADPHAPEAIGYAESKYVCERLLDGFSVASNIPSTILRVGQIAGPVLSDKGAWGKQEWFPSLVASSRHLGLLPSDLGSMDVVDWVPVDLLANIMTELLLGDAHRAISAKNAQLYNLVNPKPTAWSSVLPAVQVSLGGSDKVKIVPLAEWFAALEKSSNDNFGFGVEQNPAVKLLEFFRSLAGESRATENRSAGHGGKEREVVSRYDVSRLLKDSNEAAKLPMMSEEWLKMWMKQWAF